MARDTTAAGFGGMEAQGLSGWPSRVWVGLPVSHHTIPAVVLVLLLGLAVPCDPAQPWV